MMTDKNSNEKIILALDVGTKDEAIKYFKILKNKISIIKIGSYLFTRLGPEIIHLAHGEGFKVFLDLKFHDIPNTVAKTSEIVSSYGIFMFTIHTMGGKTMMKDCVKSVKQSCSNPPKIIGVTLLSSIDEIQLHKELKIGKKVKSYVKILSRAAYDAGLDGVVGSGEEIMNIKKTCEKDFLVVVPGIRPSWFKEPDDQKRTLTPKEALQIGADYLVIGRPILMSPDPAGAIEKIYEEISTVK
ncbi:MAG: orotidine-5'-phosphate decarboxylase [Candidatus Firestonebacteria bacterium]|nr:orotidine-5'-phosphate decarboxylase [Candidatus Firestonebacteria bacterium]